MNKRMIGAAYEETALNYLIQKGHILITRNYRTRTGEIDLITRDGNYIVFTEVKFRKDLRKGYGYEAVDRKKQKAIIQTARYYLLTHGYGENAPCRFDVISFLDDEITHLENAFEL